MFSIFFFKYFAVMVFIYLLKEEKKIIFGVTDY